MNSSKKIVTGVSPNQKAALNAANAPAGANPVATMADVGGPIYRAVYQLDYDGVSATDVVVLEDNFPVSPLSPTYNSVGSVDLNQQISLIPCVLSTSQMFLDSLGTYWRFFIFQASGLPVLRTQSSADAITWVDADYTNDADPSYSPRCLVICESF